MSISSSSSSMSSVSLIGMKKRVVKRKNETKKKKKKRKKASENETQNEFSRRVSGILMRAINNRTKDKRKKKSPHVRQWRTFVGKILKNEILRPELSNKVRERIESIVNELAQIFSEEKIDDETCTHHLQHLRESIVLREIFSDSRQGYKRWYSVCSSFEIDPNERGSHKISISQHLDPNTHMNLILTERPVMLSGYFGNVFFLFTLMCLIPHKFFKQVPGESSKTDMFMKKLIGILKRSAEILKEDAFP